MKLLLILGLTFGCMLETRAEPPPAAPKRVGITADFRQLLLAHKWSWSNVSAGVPDRECVFMPDGTFRHPHFTARFAIKDLHTVILNRAGGERAVMTFRPDYKSFEVLDFDKKRRITGKQLSN